MRTVSVITCCYNQENTVERAIKSVLDQTLDTICLIVIDDGSTDGTVNKIEYTTISYDGEKKRLFWEKEHEGMMKSYKTGFDCIGEDYIAFCDGDDYWIDDKKLEKQVAYMDENCDCVLCYTKVFTEINGNKTPMNESVDFINSNMSFDVLLKGNAYIHAQSYLIRASVFNEYIDFQKFIDKGFKLWDYPIVLELIKRGRFHCLDFHSAVYVKNQESTTNTRNKIKRFKYILTQYHIKLYYILKYGCKLSTLFYLIYKFTRDIYSTIFGRWYK